MNDFNAFEFLIYTFAMLGIPTLCIVVIAWATDRWNR